MNPDLNSNNPGYDYLPYDSLKNNKKWEWTNSLTTVFPSKGSTCDDLPPDPPDPPDPDDPCKNCIQDEGEDAIDCGGSCPPCPYIGNVKDEETITNTAQLRPEVKAFNKITACCSTTVASGIDVRFITKPTGSIFLLPGFTAEHGSKFRTQTQDLSQYERLCGHVCYDYTLPSALTVPPDKLYIYNLNYAVQFNYTIYKNTEVVFYSYKPINSDGNHYLWDCFVYDGYNIPTGRVYYKMAYWLYYCDGNIVRKEHNFYVDYCYEKSSTEEPEEEEDLDPQQSSSSDNLNIQDQKSAPSLSIIPNPNPGIFQLETNFPLSDIANFKITNFLGVSVYETKNLTTHTIQMQNSASGMFFVVIMLKDGSVLTQKMMVQRY
jgi:hypothetical protein